MPELNTISTLMTGDVWSSREPQYVLETLCDRYGSRFCGSSNEHQAAEFLRDRLASYGFLKPSLEEFPVHTWQRGDLEIGIQTTLVDSYGLTGLSLPYSCSCDLNLPLVDAGDGEEADYVRLGSAVKGKVVLTDAESTAHPGLSRPSHRAEKFAYALRAGAAAVVFTNKNPGQLPITGAIYAQRPHGKNESDHESAVAGIGVSFETGQLLRRHLRAGPVKISIKATNQTKRSHSYNVVADLAGSSKADEFVTLGAHYDGHDISPSASDDAAGVAVGMGAARVLAAYAKMSLARNVRLVFFGSEELGLLGSWYHVANSPDAIAKTRFFLNLDGAGRGVGIKETLRLTADMDIAPYFAGVREEMNYHFEIVSKMDPNSDHVPFMMEGCRSATLCSSDWAQGMQGRGWGHTSADTVDKVHLRALQSAAALTARLVLTMANEDQLPFLRRSSQQVREQLEQDGRLDLLEHHWGEANRSDL